MLVVLTASYVTPGTAETCMAGAVITASGHHCTENIDVNYNLSGLNSALRSSMGNNRYPESRLLIQKILDSVNKESADSALVSESYYLIGVYHLLTGDDNEALIYLGKAESIMEEINLKGDLWVRTLYNLAVANNYKGDFRNMFNYSKRSLEAGKKIYGDNSPELISSLSNLITASSELQDYETSLDYGNLAISILAKSGESMLHESELADLYYNMGVGYSRLSDFSRAILYLEKTEQIFERGKLTKDDRYINLLNSMAITYQYMRYGEKSEEYYIKGIKIAENYNSIIADNIVNSYAIKLAKEGRIEEGRQLLASLMQRGRKAYGSRSRNYMGIIKNYAEYLRVYGNDYKGSLYYYEECIRYLSENEGDLLLREPVYLGYSVALAFTGEPFRALGIINQMLYPESAVKPANVIVNPAADVIKADQRSLNILRAKYQIMYKLYETTGLADYLKASASTSELIIAVLEKVRINLSQEESRLILGDRYRDIYLSAIRDFDICYRTTGKQIYLEKAFEYSERSKVAGLLASTRELKATQFHIPPDIADLEKELQREISFNNARIETENSKREPDPDLLNDWNDELLKLSRKRDSLVNIFEREYPGYHALKYNTQVVKPGEIPGIAGPRWNYINYIASDSVLYIFVVNRRHNQLISLPVGPEFFDKIHALRNLLISPSRSGGARTEFELYVKLSLDLYRVLIEPVREYLVSDNLLISPDNILSYLPFEALVTEPYEGDGIMYRELQYLNRKYRISYTYSVTFMAESTRKPFRFRNNLVSFAPVYSSTGITDTELSRGNAGLLLEDLPYARQEAKYVTDLFRGRLYLNNEALESVFKTEAGKYDIIHLAMHTILNDRSPMHSKMIFYPGDGQSEDGFLNTYEVYGLALKAAMVVLSSCNTGSGLLLTGEGVLSLARGFMYSGSQSVVMALWEVEDRSGSEIIKQFYRNLRKGNTKTEALQRARIDYLSKASQLGSHPSFWAAQVIYGNDEPLVKNRKTVALLLFLSALAALFAFIYGRRST